jgi:c-di-GMP-binding flagellar brake protein YcgR
MSTDDKPVDERRRSPRLKATHEVVLSTGSDFGEGSGERIVAQSVDLSLGGVYCTLDRYLPVFSKFRLHLTLPLRDADGADVVEECEVQAVVVRIQPEEPLASCNSYEAALAFLGVGEHTELVLARYLLQAMLRGDTA